MPGFGHLLQHLYRDLHSCPMGDWISHEGTGHPVPLLEEAPAPLQWHWKEGEDQSCWTRHAPQPPALPIWHSPLPRHADGSHGDQHQPEHSHPLHLPVFLQPALRKAKVESSVLHMSPGSWMGLASQETSPGPAHPCHPLLMLWGSETGRHAPFYACWGVERNEAEPIQGGRKECFCHCISAGNHLVFKANRKHPALAVGRHCSVSACGPTATPVPANSARSGWRRSTVTHELDTKGSAQSHPTALPDHLDTALSQALGVAGCWFRQLLHWRFLLQLLPWGWLIKTQHPSCTDKAHLSPRTGSQCWSLSTAPHTTKDEQKKLYWVGSRTTGEDSVAPWEGSSASSRDMARDRRAAVSSRAPHLWAPGSGGWRAQSSQERWGHTSALQPQRQLSQTNMGKQRKPHLI